MYAQHSLKTAGQTYYSSDLGMDRQKPKPRSPRQALPTAKFLNLMTYNEVACLPICQFTEGIGGGLVSSTKVYGNLVAFLTYSVSQYACLRLKL